MTEIAGNASDYSLGSIRLMCALSGSKVKIATGFLQKFGNRIFLVSNWHVFSGRDCFTQKCLDGNGATPIAFKFFVSEGVFEGFEGRHNTIIREITIRISHDEYGDSPIWFQHPGGPTVDLAAIDVTEELSNVGRLVFPGAKDIDLKMDLRPGSEVFIIGYPMGLTVQRGIPIWKRASVASEPGYYVDNLNIFLVDTATREGMSGSPVYQFLRLAPKKHEGRIIDQVISKFVGVYSGRYGVKDEFEAQIGRVVRREELTRMLQNPSIATTCWQA